MFYMAIKEILRWLFIIAKKILQINESFIPLFPAHLKTNYLFSLRGGLIKVQIRNYTDAQTLIEVLFYENYNLSTLVRFGEIMNFYKKTSSNKPSLIIDCGANIGLSAKYFSCIYPQAKIVGLEPDMGNYQMALANNAGNENVKIINSAVGSENGLAHIINSDAGSNAFQVEKVSGENSCGEHIDIISINKILENNAEKPPFIIKIDIEGFESELFSQNCEWIDKFPVIIIELHDWLFPKTAKTHAFIAEISKHNRDFVIHHDNIVSISNTLM